MKLIQTALKFRTSVFVLILLIVVVGVDSYRALPLEAAPDIEIPIILVTTVYPGVAPAEMETLVTNVMERDLKDLKDVKELVSTSSESVSVVKIEFESGVDMDNAYQKVRDKVDKAKVDLPLDAEDPILTEINISDFPIMLVNLFGALDLVRLKQLAEDLEERIEAIQGVLDVEITGGRDREIQVLLDPERMEYLGVGVGQVINRIQQEHINMPGGNLDLGESKYLVRVSGEYKVPKLMEDIVLKTPNGNPVKVGDIGRVVDGFKDRESISRVSGEECVTLRIQKRSGENIVRIADEVKALLAEAEPNLPAGVKYLIRQDHSKYIRDTVRDLENSVISGLILVLGILFFFMGLRNSFFVAVAIPLSLLLTVAILALMGITLNMVVLFALIIALGMLVDNSIVVVENIFRHASEGASRFKAAYEGTKEVAWPIIASTATTVAAFGPLLFWPDVMGEFMAYLPKTVIIALMASLFVALVINPVLAATFLRRGTKMFDDSGEVRSLAMRLYKRVLAWCVGHPKTLLLISNATLVGIIVLYGLVGAGLEFFPATTPERAQVLIEAPLGTQLTKTDSLSKVVEGIASQEDNSQEVITNVGFGGGELLVGGSKTHSAVIDLEFKDRHDRVHSTWDTLASLRDKMSQLSGGEYRVEMEKMGPPTGKAVEVQIAGEDYDVLNRLSRQIKDVLATVGGVVDIKDDYDPGSPEIKVTIDREKAMGRNVNTFGIAQAISTAINGTKASVLRDGEDEIDIIVRYQPSSRASIKDLLAIKITGKDDVQIPLGDVAMVRTQGGLGSISHTDRKRTVKVSADVMGRSSSEVLIDVRKILGEKVSVPPGYRIHFGGESEEQDKAAAFLGRAFLIGLFVIALILITQFDSIMQPGIIMGSVFMSLIGVMIGLIVLGGKFSIIMTGMGVISLAGVVVNNAIVLIDYVNQLRGQGMTVEEAVIRAGIVRFRPVMMTAITTVLGMLPMALGISIDFTTWTVDIGGSSAEWWGPMAQAIISGLLFATLLTLLMVPVMYVVQFRFSSSLMRLLRWRRAED